MRCIVMAGILVAITGCNNTINVTNNSPSGFNGNQAELGVDTIVKAKPAEVKPQK